MNSKLLAAATAAVLCLAGTHTASAGYGIIPSKTTLSRLVNLAEVTVRAKLVTVENTQVNEVNPDVILYRYNNDDDSIRRDAVLEVTRVIRGEGVELGTLPVVSIRQFSLSQYPASLQSGQEGIFFLYRRAGDGLWEVLGESRGMVAAEDVGGDLSRAEFTLDSFVSLNLELEPEQLPPVIQGTLMHDLMTGQGRVAVDAAIEFGWNFADHTQHFDDHEKDQLLQALAASERGSMLRRELITAVGRVLPHGGDQMLVDMIATDASTSVSSLGSWALEQYGRTKSAGMLLDKYLTLAVGDTVGRARVLQALGIMRPRDNDQERVQRERFTDVLRGLLANPVSDSEITVEALLAARDMRYTADELGDQLRKIVADFRTGKLADEALFRRAIVALAATRNAEAREFLLSLKGDFAGRFDKHIELSIMMPFTVLVDGK
jgi:hypothetical protein